jgi:hypothetical protein
MPMVQRVYGPDARGGMGDALPVRARRRKPSIERRFLRWAVLRALDCDTRVVASRYSARAHRKMAGVSA